MFFVLVLFVLVPSVDSLRPAIVYLAARQKENDSGPALDAETRVLTPSYPPSGRRVVHAAMPLDEACAFRHD